MYKDEQLKAVSGSEKGTFDKCAKIIKKEQRKLKEVRSSSIIL
ncbi:hypothetical protein AGMMS49950_07550 [Endomicrobiia bacterium]|nr:hypothetical protein AGMMS49950_07550 [Endomicrobiia bacterium]